MVPVAIQKSITLGKSSQASYLPNQSLVGLLASVWYGHLVLLLLTEDQTPSMVKRATFGYQFFVYAQLCFLQLFDSQNKFLYFFYF